MSEVWRSMAEGMAFGRDWREKNLAEQKRSRLAELAQGVFQNDPKATMEAYSLDPNTAKAYTSGADRQHQIFKTLALQIKQAPTPDLRARIYAMYAPRLKQILPDAPDQWDESYLPMVDQVIAQAGYLDEGNGGKPAGVQEFDYLTQGFSQDELAAARRTKLGLAPRAALPQVYNGAGGVYGIDRANYSAAPITMGGPPNRGPQGAPIQIDPSIPEHVRAMIAQNPEAFAQGGNFIGPPQFVGGGQQLQPPAKTTEQVVTLTPQEVAAMGLAPGTVAQRDQSGKVSIVSDPQRDPRAMTAAQQKTAQAAKVKLQSLGPLRRQLDTVRDLFAKLKGSWSAGGFGQGYIPTEEGQKFDKAVAQLSPLVRQLTRVPGEGAMSDYESRLAVAALPDRTNYEGTTEQQIQGLYDLIDSIEQGYSGLLSEAAPQGQAPATNNSDPLGIR